MGGARGRLIESADKIIAVELITEATNNGCRVKVACKDIGIVFNTFQGWKNDLEDKRK